MYLSGGGAAGHAVTVSLAAGEPAIAHPDDPAATQPLDGTVVAGSFLGGSARYDVQVKRAGSAGQRAFGSGFS